MLKNIFKKIILKIVGRHNAGEACLNEQGAKYTGTILSGNINLLTIGERVSFGGDVSIVLNASVEIGNDTLIASGVKILTSTHNYNNNPMWKDRIDKPVTIGSNVWIGANAIILPGVKIGNYSVVGAGSIVTKHVPEKMVVAGNPAKYIKTRIVSAYDTSAVYPGRIISETYLRDDTIIKENL
jgi:acetyltransferase-like isoleucine patch superfamily enzyme